jgi:hypothetical protein
MPTLIDISPEAKAWVERALADHPVGPVFGRVASRVIWSDARGADGALLVALDPVALAASVNTRPYPMLLGHDPGRPLGKMLKAEVFTSPAGEVFVAAVMGFYGEDQRLGFGALGFDVEADAPSPTELPTLHEGLRFTVHADPRDIELSALDDLARDAPIPVDVEVRSNNDAEPQHTLVVISVMFVTLVWNPFVTTLATEAAKDVYVGLKRWLTEATVRIAHRRNPAVEVQSTHGGCHLSFMFRGQDIARHYKAHDALPEAAARAARLIGQMIAAGIGPVRLVYEFHPTTERWHPSYAELGDGRLVSDNASLIATENLPSGLSLGLGLQSLEEAD